MYRDQMSAKQLFGTLTAVAGALRDAQGCPNADACILISYAVQESHSTASLCKALVMSV